MRSELRKYYSQSVKAFVKRKHKDFLSIEFFSAGCALDPLSLAFETGLPRDGSGWVGIAHTRR